MQLTRERTAGLLLLAGFLMLLVGIAVAPLGAYLGPIDDRLAVIDAHNVQWLASKVFDGLALVLPALGFALLAIALQRRQPSPWTALGGASLALAAVPGVLYVYALATDPRFVYDRASPAPVALLLIGMIALGLLGFGIGFLRGRYSRRVGAFSAAIGGGVLVAELGVIVLRIGPEAAFVLASGQYLAVVAIGLMLIRR